MKFWHLIKIATIYILSLFFNWHISTNVASGGGSGAGGGGGGGSSGGSGGATGLETGGGHDSTETGSAGGVSSGGVDQGTRAKSPTSGTTSDDDELFEDARDDNEIYFHIPVPPTHRRTSSEESQTFKSESSRDHDDMTESDEENKNETYNVVQKRGMCEICVYNALKQSFFSILVFQRGV